MNKQKSLIGAAALMALVALGGCGVAASPQATPRPVATMAPMSTSMPLPAMTEAAGSMASMIHIESGAFRDPAPVAPGSIVTVMNMDTTECTVAADDGSFSVTVPAGATATFKAPGKPGAYPFHGGTTMVMHGVVTVR
ncbi:MAG: cupredoxin domain-containing protein [Specibacter sp.]